MSTQRLPRLMIVVSAALAVAPKCPLCLWALFGAFGAGALSGSVYRVWLPPVTALWLAFSVGALVVRSGGRRRYGPALLGLCAGVAVFVGKFVVNKQALVYVGVAALAGAAVWRVRCGARASGEVCPQCEGLPAARGGGRGMTGSVGAPTRGSR